MTGSTFFTAGCIFIDQKYICMHKRLQFVQVSLLVCLYCVMAGYLSSIKDAKISLIAFCDQSTSWSPEAMTSLQVSICNRFSSSSDIGVDLEYLFRSHLDDLIVDASMKKVLESPSFVELLVALTKLKLIDIGSIFRRFHSFYICKTCDRVCPSVL